MFYPLFNQHLTHLIDNRRCKWIQASEGGDWSFGMVSNYVPSLSFHSADGRIKFDELGYALHHCYDLPVLQMSNLTQMAMVMKQASDETGGLEIAKALRKELIACAEQITQRPRCPLEEIISAIEKARLHLGAQDLVKLQKTLGIPFPRNMLDLARYYAVRLLMEGVNHQMIADFLDVDLRTVANYILRAKEHIRLILESRASLI